MRFVWIPAGTFQMGSPLTEEGRKEGETLHQVTLSKGFFMGALLVCQEEWQAIMGDNPSQLKGEPQLPVDSVRFRECQDFCKKLWALDDKAYRLPTEAEWEYACRAGTTTAFHFGETITTAQVNYGGEEMQRKGSKALYQGKTTPVGRFPANAFGLHDMHGNLWEWCQDWYRVDVAAAATVDPQGPTTGNSRVLRGGSWVEPAEDCRSARRLRGGPNSRGGNCGFRLCFFPD
jgi:formylglycine-generating enzyme required for sulfatase activity